MALLRIGSRVILKETGEYGVVIGKNNTSVHLKMDSGSIIRVVKDAIVVVGLVRQLWFMVKGLVQDIVDTFKGKYDEK